MSEAYPFTPDFQRKILALAVRGDLLTRVPGVFKSLYFGTGDGIRVRSPRQRIAELVEQFSQAHRTERPGAATIDELIRRLALTLKPEERKAVEEEWRAVREIEIPDPQFISAETAAWAKDCALVQAVVQAASLIEQVQRSGKREEYTRVRRMIDEALAVGELRSLGEGLVSGIVDRMVWWQQDHSRRRIPTGLPALDASLRGGPQFGETFYVLGPPKGSKTTFLINVALGASMARHGVVFFSYEMSARAVAARMDRLVSRCTREELKEDLTPLAKALEGMRSMGRGEIWVQQCQARKHGCAEVAKVVEQRRGMGHEIDLVVLDYLNLMGGGREREKRHELVQISRDIDSLSKELDVVMWSGTLVGRKAVEKERVQKTDLWEAYELVAVAHGMVAICGTMEMRAQQIRRLFLSALREEEDEKYAGAYHLDKSRMMFKPITEHWTDKDQPSAEDDIKE